MWALLGFGAGLIIDRWHILAAYADAVAFHSPVTFREVLIGYALSYSRLPARMKPVLRHTQYGGM